MSADLHQLDPDGFSAEAHGPSHPGGHPHGDSHAPDPAGEAGGMGGKAGELRVASADYESQVRGDRLCVRKGTVLRVMLRCPRIVRNSAVGIAAT